MKKFNLTAILFMALITFVGCNDSDEPNNNDLNDILGKYLNVEDGKLKMLDVSKVPGMTGTAKDLDMTPTSVYPTLLVGKGFEGITAVGWVYGSSEAPAFSKNGVKVFDAFTKFPSLKYENTKEKQKNMALNLSDLQPNTTYYIRGFVKHGDKVSYTYNELKITTPKKDKTGGNYKFMTTTGSVEEEVPQMGDFILKGTIETKTNINKNNVAEVFMIDFGSDDENDEEAFLAGQDKIVNKKFSIPISNFENKLKYIDIEDFKSYWKGNITKLECKKSKIKMGLIAGIFIKKSGIPSLIDMIPLVLSTNEIEILNTKGDVNIPHMIMYMYCNEDFIFHKEFEKPKDVKSDDIKLNLNLKKGWNLVKVDNIDKGERTIYTSISKIPSDYKWRLGSDLVAEKSNGSSMKVVSYFENTFLKQK